MRSLSLLLLGVLAGGCRDAQLDPLQQALHDYDRGRQAAEAGDWATAQGAFQAALAAHPLSPALHLWLAESHAQVGELDTARQILGQGIDRAAAPEQQVELRYNRAAYAARAGDTEAAAQDLQYLYARQLLQPIVAGEDPDFASLAADARFVALAPPPRIEAQLSAAVPQILRGERYTLEVLLRSRADASISALLAPEAVEAALLVQERAVEDRLGVEEGAGWSQRRLTLDWRAVAEGEALLGPVRFEAHGTATTVGPQAVRVAALPGQEASVPGATASANATLWLPSAVMAGREAPWIGRLADGRPAALMLPGMAARLSIDAGPSVHLEYREAGQTLWLAEVFSLPDPHQTTPVTVTILRGSREILRETL